MIDSQTNKQTSGLNPNIKFRYLRIVGARVAATTHRHQHRKKGEVRLVQDRRHTFVEETTTECRLRSNAQGFELSGKVLSSKRLAFCGSATGSQSCPPLFLNELVRDEQMPSVSFGYERLGLDLTDVSILSGIFSSLWFFFHPLILFHPLVLFCCSLVPSCVLF